MKRNVFLNPFDLLMAALLLSWLAVVVFFDKPLQDPAELRIILLELGEAALYFGAAWALLYVGVAAKERGRAYRAGANAQAQQLEFITRRFEAEFEERSLYDPRGPKA